MRNAMVAALAMLLSVDAYAAPSISLGAPFQSDGYWHVPVMLDPDGEDSLLTVKGPDLNLAENLHMTGTLAWVPDPQFASNGYTLPGDFWPDEFTYPYVQRFADTRPGYYWTGSAALWGPVNVDGSHCGPGHTNPGTLYAIRVQGEGTIRLIAEFTLLAKACDPYNYVPVNVSEQAVAVPPEQPTRTARSTWGRVKGIYR